MKCIVTLEVAVGISESAIMESIVSALPKDVVFEKLEFVDEDEEIQLRQWEDEELERAAEIDRI